MCFTVLALGTGYTKRISPTQLYVFKCDLSGSTTFFHLVLKTVRYSGHIYRTQNKFWFSPQLQRYIIVNVHTSSCKVPVILVSFNKLNFLNGFSSNPQISNFVKICPVGAELFHADGRTDRHTHTHTHTHTDDEANSHFSKFCKRG